MSFVSVCFALFFCAFCALYHAARALGKVAPRAQNGVFLAASLVFYAQAGARFLPFLLYVIFVSYAAGLFCRSRALLALFVVADALPLLLFKCGLAHGPFPLGLSFFTFQGIGYIADVYAERVAPERDFVRLALFVGFFPTVSSGPIQRAGRLLPQLARERRFCYGDAADGVRLFAWGLFKKLLIADRIAVYVDFVYAGAQAQCGSALLLATVLYSLQIYCDFSGYSDMAIGVMRFLGFGAERNFDHPYFARSVGEFWRRWHMSLSFWLRDFVYIPLGGSRAPFFRVCLNLMATFLLSGLWHGSSARFAVWGALHGAFLCAERAARRSGGRVSPRVPAAVRVMVTFCLVSFAWIFFRAESVRDALLVAGKIASAPGELRGFAALAEAHGAKEAAKLLFGLTDPAFGYLKGMAKLFALLCALFCAECATRRRPGLEVVAGMPFALRWALYAALCTLILVALPINANTEFLYFSF